MNKLLKTIKENNERFDKEFKVIGNYFSKNGYPAHPIHIPFVGELKSHITQSRIKELEALIELAKEQSKPFYFTQDKSLETIAIPLSTFIKTLKSIIKELKK